MQNYQDYFANFQNRRTTPSNWDFTGIIDGKAQQHIRDVYSTLAASLCVAALGVIVWMRYHFGLGLPAVAMFGLTLWLGFTPNMPSNLSKRKAILAGIAFCSGLTTAPLIEYNLNVDPGLLLTAFGCTTALFGSFTAAAFLAKRRQYLFLGGVLSTAISMLFIMRMVNFFTGSSGLYDAELYLGLLVFSGYVVFDTQMIIEKAHMQNPDPVKDALGLFLDFVTLLVKIISILMRNKEKKNKRRN